LSKLFERLVARQLLDYLNIERLLPELQSAYRAFHSTETAVLKVMADILLALDRGDTAFLILLDLSSAFDTVDHATLLKRMEISYGLKGNLLGLFQSYLTGRKQSVQCNNASPYPLQFCLGSRKDRSLDRSFFFYTLQTCCDW